MTTTTKRTGVFLSPEYRETARRADKIHEELVRRYGGWYSFFSPAAKADPLYVELTKAQEKLRQLDEERRAHHCTRCGAKLTPGENWYTMRPEYICTDCKPAPVYQKHAGTIRTNCTESELNAAEDRCLSPEA